MTNHAPNVSAHQGAPMLTLGAPDTLFGVDRTTSTTRPAVTSWDGQESV